MKFKMGSKVEEKKKKDSAVSWRREEIFSSHGDIYAVRHDIYPGMESKARIERVSRRNIRSSPPPLTGVDNREIGQIVEVLDDSSWKIATIVKVLDRNYYLVCKTGCIKEICVHGSNTRELQSQPVEKQHLIGKGFGQCRRPEQLSALKPSKKVSKVPSFSTRNGFHVRDDILAAQECTELQKSQISSSLLLNRASHFALSKNETSRNIQDLEAIERDFKRRRVAPAALNGQVNVIANCKEKIMDGRYGHPSLNDASGGHCLLKQTKRRDYFPTRGTESSDACSVGSCSINDRFPNKFFSPEEVRCQGTELLRSDAESFQNSADKEERFPLSSPEKIASSIHILELRAYRCTLEALYASGPLSWDQEALLTNLRIALRISNDEHLAELRTLISAGSSIHGNGLDAFILCLQKSNDDACICSTSPGIIGRTSATTVPQIRQFMAFCVTPIKLHDLFCQGSFNISMFFAEGSIRSYNTMCVCLWLLQLHVTLICCWNVLND